MIILSEKGGDRTLAAIRVLYREENRRDRSQVAWREEKLSLLIFINYNILLYIF